MNCELHIGTEYVIHTWEFSIVACFAHCASKLCLQVTYETCTVEPMLGYTLLGDLNFLNRAG